MKTKQAFIVEYVFFSTVPPFNDQSKYRNRNLKFRLITQPSKTTDYLFNIFDASRNDCKVEISFKSNQGQENEIRTMILKIVTSKKVPEKEMFSRLLAKKMYDVTDHRNGSGLFVIIQGTKGDKTRIVLSRFKGAEGLHSQGKVLEYLAEVFTKQSRHYKLAVYEGVISEKSFWKGYAIDRQTAENTYKPFSYFWINEFLQSETTITSGQGTTQLAKIIKIALNKTTSLAQQEQLISAIVNLKYKPNTQISVKSFSETYLNQDLREILKGEINDDFYNSIFTLDSEVYEKELGSTVLTLDEGIMAYVPTFKYDKHVKEEISNKGTKKVTIEGFLKEKKVNVTRNLKHPNNKKEKNKK